MKSKRTAIGAISFSIAAIVIIVSTNAEKNIGGKDALKGVFPSNDIPTQEASLFSPFFINTGLITRDVTMTPEMDELYFSVASQGHRFSTIMYSVKTKNGWSEPEIAPHMNDFNYLNFEPCISPDGKKLFFLSSRPDTANNKEGGNQDLWVMEREDGSWGEPYNLGDPVSTEAQEYYPSLTKDGTLYFTRTGEDANYIYRSKFIDGKYQEPELLPEQVNCGTTRFNAFVSPDEDYIIVPAAGMEESINKSTDYYIVFRDAEDHWSEPLNMGKPVNSASNLEYSASVSPNGSALFFMSARVVPADSVLSSLPDRTLQSFSQMPQAGNPNIYWISAEIIDKLRSQAVFNTSY